MAGVEFELEGHDKVISLLERLIDRVAKPQVMMDEIGQHLASSTQERFKSSRAPDGSKWKDLSEATYLARMMRGVKGGLRKKRGGTKLKAVRNLAGIKPLIDYGHLRNSITHQAGRNQVRIGTNLAYGAIHQFGGKAGRGRKVKIPARPYLGMSKKDEGAVQRIAESYLLRTIEGRA